MVFLINKKSVVDIIDSSIFKERLNEMKDYGYTSLVFCVIDSVYSIGAKYASTKAVVERFANHLGITLKSEYLISEFVKTYGSLDFDYLANEIFKNRQRTSTSNGILKAEAIVHFINVLHNHNIETTDDLLNYKDKYRLMYDIKKIKGQGKGLTFDYVMMLAGDVDTFKLDRHIINFFTEYLNLEDVSDLETKFRNQLEIAQKTYPNMNIRTLDGSIWLFMSSRK